MKKLINFCRYSSSIYGVFIFYYFVRGVYYLAVCRFIAYNFENNKLKIIFIENTDDQEDKPRL